MSQPKFEAQALEGVTPLPAQQSNFISELMAWADDQLRVRVKGRELVARWNLNGTLGKLSNEQLQAISSFEHLDVEKVTNAVTALQAVNEALGDDVSGQATNLLKLKG